jgi:hypothetical protein
MPRPIASHFNNLLWLLYSLAVFIAAMAVQP